MSDTLENIVMRKEKIVNELSKNNEILIDSKGVHIPYDVDQLLDDNFLIAILKQRGYKITKEF